MIDRSVSTRKVVFVSTECMRKQRGSKGSVSSPRKLYPEAESSVTRAIMAIGYMLAVFIRCAQTFCNRACERVDAMQPVG